MAMTSNKMHIIENAILARIPQQLLILAANVQQHVLLLEQHAMQFCPQF